MDKSTGPLLTMIALGACANPEGPPPSLSARAAEAIDPRVPVESAAQTGVIDPALAQRLYALVAQASAGEAAFRDAAAAAEQLVSAAGPRQSESWVVAQQALSAAVAARAPTTRALAEIDAIAAEALARAGGIAPADLGAIQAAAAEVGEIDRAQAARIDAMRARLAG